MSDLGDMLLCFALGYRAKDIANSAANAFCVAALSGEAPAMREKRLAERAKREAYAAERAEAAKGKSDPSCQSTLVIPTGPMSDWEREYFDKVEKIERKAWRRYEREKLAKKIRSYIPF